MYDYVKLTRVIKYIYDTVYLPLVIGWDESSTLLWSSDASFAVHNNMHSHTGAILTFRKGAMFTLLNKKKVNSTSLTVAEIIGDNDAINFVMWVKLIFEQQVSKNI